MILKPGFGSLYIGIQVFDKSNIPVAYILNNENIVQPYIYGREFTVAVLPTEDGTDSICFPPVEVVPFEQKAQFIAGNASGKTFINYEPCLESEIKEKK